MTLPMAPMHRLQAIRAQSVTKVTDEEVPRRRTWGKGIQPAVHAIAPVPTPVGGVLGEPFEAGGPSRQRMPQHPASEWGRSPRPTLRAGKWVKSGGSADR